MKCIFCKEGYTAPSTVTVTMKRGNTLVIVRDAPASVCQNCGEYSLDKSGAGKLYRQGAESVRGGNPPVCGVIAGKSIGSDRP